MEASTENTNSRWLSIIGIGQDGAEGLSPLARSLISGAELVVGGARHLELAAQLVRHERLQWPSPMHDAFRRSWPGAAVPWPCSPAATRSTLGSASKSRLWSLQMRCCVYRSPPPSASPQAGWDGRCRMRRQFRFTGAQSRAFRYLHPGARILALSWDGSTPAKVAALLSERRCGDSAISVLEDLGGPEERVTHHRADGFEHTGVSPLNVIAIEVAAGPQSRVIGLSSGLEDDLFESDGQLTKREVRAVTLAALAPRRDELLWDIGLGAGSIAIEWLLCHPSLRAIGVEAREDRAARAMRNALALGAPELRVIIGHAPQALAGLAPPDAVFIGGGFTDEGVFEAAWTALRRGGRIVANAVTLESETRLKEAFECHGGELVRIDISKAVKIGGFHGWRPAMPVTQWRAVKP